jgi:SAM-dependent methyltransferase
MASEPGVPLSSATIDRLAVAVYPSFALLAGMQLDVFTPLQDGPLTAEEVAQALGVSPAKLRPLLYALVVAELLTVDGGRFANTPEAQQFLVRGRPTYLGGRQHIFVHNWQATLQTATTIRTGIPQDKLDFAHMSAEALAHFYRGLHPASVATGRDLARREDFSGARTLLDVGGGSGGLALGLTERYPHLQATVVDLPSVTPITQQYIMEAGAQARVRVMAADVVNDPLTGTFEVAVLKSFLQVLAPEQARAALRHVSLAITPGGVLYVIGIMLDNSRLSPPEAVARNLLFLNEYDVGQAYTEQEYTDWLREAGFAEVTRVPVAEGNSILSARKRA